MFLGYDRDKTAKVRVSLRSENKFRAGLPEINFRYDNTVKPKKRGVLVPNKVVLTA